LSISVKIFFRSKLKSLEENLELAAECLDKETQELNAINLQIQNAIAESTKHINAFKHFSEIHLESIVNDLHRLQEILVESQSRECAKVLVKKSVKINLAYPNSYLLSISLSFNCIY